MQLKNLKLAIIGIGYVGLPLALEFGKQRSVVGFDLKKKRIDQLKKGIDSTLEISKKDIFKSKYLKFTSNQSDLKKANCYIITVPTPIDHNKIPDLNLFFQNRRVSQDS